MTSKYEIIKKFKIYGESYILICDNTLFNKKYYSIITPENDLGYPDYIRLNCDGIAYALYRYHRKSVLKKCESILKKVIV